MVRATLVNGCSRTPLRSRPRLPRPSPVHATAAAGTSPRYFRDEAAAARGWSLVTPPAIGYRRRHGDARRGLRGGPDPGRGGRRALVAADDGAGTRAVRLAVSVRRGARPRGGGTCAGGSGGSPCRGVAPGGEGRPLPGGIAEVAARQEPDQADGGRRGDGGGSPCGEGRAFPSGGSGAAGEAACGSRRRFEKRRERATAEGERPAARGAGASAGAEGQDRVVARGDLGAAEVGTGGAGVPVEGKRQVAQSPGADGPAEGHDRGAAHGTARGAQGNGVAEQGDRAARRGGRGIGRAGVGVDGPGGRDRGAARGECRAAQDGEGLGESVQMARHRERRSALGVAQLPRARGAAQEPASRRDRPAERGYRPGALVPCTEMGGPAGHRRTAEQAARPAPQGDRTGERHHRIAAPAQRRAAGRDAGVEGREDGAGLARRDAGSPGREAALDPEGSVEGAVRQQEREAEEDGHGSLGAASSPARRATAAPRDPGSARRRNGATRRRKRASVPVAASPMSPTASV